MKFKRSMWLENISVYTFIKTKTKHLTNSYAISTRLSNTFSVIIHFVTALGVGSRESIFLHQNIVLTITSKQNNHDESNNDDIITTRSSLDVNLISQDDNDMVSMDINAEDDGLQVKYIEDE